MQASQQVVLKLGEAGDCGSTAPGAPFDICLSSLDKLAKVAGRHFPEGTAGPRCLRRAWHSLPPYCTLRT